MIWVWAACNRYDFMQVEGHLQGTVSDEADVLFVVDNSKSMVEEATSLGVHFRGFVRDLEGDDARYGTDGLADAVGSYVDKVSDPARFASFQLAITSTDATTDRGALLGPSPVLVRDEPDIAARFLENLLCETACFPTRDSLPSDPESACGDVTQEGLDCACGVGAWLGNCGAGREEGLEAVFLALCRAVEEPPVECFELPELFGDADVGTNVGLLRPGATFIPVIVSDEGDNSRREGEVVAVPRKYQELFRAFDIPVAWAVVGPMINDAGEVICGGITASWGVERYDVLVDASGGVKSSILADNCLPADLEKALRKIGTLVGGGRGAVPLLGDPDPETLLVAVESRSIPPAEKMGRDLFGVQQWGDGWTWEEADHQVLLHGTAVPDAGETVTVWYLPL